MESKLAPKEESELERATRLVQEDMEIQEEVKRRLQHPS